MMASLPEFHTYCHSKAEYEEYVAFVSRYPSHSLSALAC